MRKSLIVLVILFACLGCKTKPVGPAVQIKNPEFQILSIAIIQADLVNTQFEAVIRIDNPNDFAIDLTSLTYELYGNGAFWASGKGIDLLHIPPHYSSEAEFYFSMNFINMDRRLLDDVIAMRRVQYKFKGEVEVEPDFPRSKSFNFLFERSGLSDVKEKAGKRPQSNGQAVYVTPAVTPAMDNW